MTFPIPVFLRWCAVVAQSLWFSRVMGTEGWHLRRHLSVSLFTDRQLARLALHGARASGLN